MGLLVILKIFEITAYKLIMSLGLTRCLAQTWMTEDCYYKQSNRILLVK